MPYCSVGMGIIGIRRLKENYSMVFSEMKLLEKTRSPVNVVPRVAVAFVWQQIKVRLKGVKLDKKFIPEMSLRNDLEN